MSGSLVKMSVPLTKVSAPLIKTSAPLKKLSGSIFAIKVPTSRSSLTHPEQCPVLTNEWLTRKNECPTHKSECPTHKNECPTQKIEWLNFCHQGPHFKIIFDSP